MTHLILFHFDLGRDRNIGTAGGKGRWLTWGEGRLPGHRLGRRGLEMQVDHGERRAGHRERQGDHGKRQGDHGERLAGHREKHSSTKGLHLLQ